MFGGREAVRVARLSAALGAGPGLLVACWLAWSAGGEWEARLPLTALRYGVAAALIVAALVTGLGARGILG